MALAAAVVASAAACGSTSSVPAGQPGASLPSAACLAAGNCTVAQQQQIAASMGITNSGGLNGCLVAGNCTAAQQQGIAAGTSAGSDSPPVPPPSSPAGSTATLSWTCAITGTPDQDDSTLWTVGYQLTAQNTSSVTADVTNGATVEFTDQYGNGIYSYVIGISEDIPAGVTANFTGQVQVSSPSEPLGGSVGQWN